jgi:arginase
VSKIAVIGAPSSAGSHHAGQEQAPGALRAAGFVTRLKAAGFDVADLGDVRGATFMPDEMTATARCLATVVEVASAVADAVADALAAGRLAIVLGGDCTITLGVMAGVQRHDPAAGLVYFDGDADLANPQSTSSGVLDAMGVAHLLGLADNRLARLGTRYPMLAARRLVLFGYDDTDPETYRPSVLNTHPDLAHFAGPSVRSDPARCSAEAAAAIASGASGTVVHFDVDAVDSRDLPLANFPHYGTGMPLSIAASILTSFCQLPRLRAIALTEVNPSYDPSGATLARYIDAVTGAITTAFASVATQGR